MSTFNKFDDPVSLDNSLAQSLTQMGKDTLRLPINKEMQEMREADPKAYIAGLKKMNGGDAQTAGCPQLELFSKTSVTEMEIKISNFSPKTAEQLRAAQQNANKPKDAYES